MKRPLSITIIGWLFILAGTVGFFYHLSELSLQEPFGNDAPLVLLIRLLATAGGILTLLGRNMGRWLLVIWMAYHVVLSYFHYFHSILELAMHTALLGVIAYFLFHRKAAAFFYSQRPG